MNSLHLKFSSLLSSFYSIMYDFRNRDRSKELCGNVGITEYCFLPCEVDRQPDDHYIVKELFQITCYVYQHGYPPEPNITPRRLLTLKERASPNYLDYGLSYTLGFQKKMAPPSPSSFIFKLDMLFSRMMQQFARAATLLE